MKAATGNYFFVPKRLSSFSILFGQYTSVPKRLSTSLLVKQGKPNPLIFLSSYFHTSNKNKISRNMSYIPFEDIKNIDAAITLFHQMLQMKPKPSASAYCKLMNIIVKMKHYSLVIVMFKNLRLSGCPVDDFTMTTVINCYCNLKEVELGFAVLASMFKSGYAIDIVSVSCLIKGLFLEAKVEKAVGLFKKLIRDKWCEVDGFTVSIVLHGLCQSGKVSDAVELLGILENENYELDVVAYTSVVDGLCKEGMVEDAMSLLSKMIEKGILPDVATYTTLIHGLCNCSRWDDATELLKQMVDHKVYPNVKTFTVLVDTFCKEGLIENAENVVQIMTERGMHPDVVTYSALMDGYCKNKEIDHAWKIFKEVPLKGLMPDRTMYSIMIQGLFSVGRCSQALELFDEMQVVGLVYDIRAYGIVLDGLFNNGKIQDAMRVLHEVESKGLVRQIYFYNILINGLCNLRKLDIARSIFNNLSSKGLYPDVTTYTVMMKGLCQEGMFQEVTELLEKMEKSGCFPNSITYNSITQGCLKRYNCFDSFNLLRQIAERDFTLDACTVSLLLQQMEISDEDLGRKSLIQKLISRADDSSHKMCLSDTQNDFAKFNKMYPGLYAWGRPMNEAVG